jgi:hypothetical protein
MTAYQRFYQLREDARPTEQDLFRLCDEQGLDFVVLEHRFPGLFSATDGCFFIYDCRRLRARAHGSTPAPGASSSGLAGLPDTDPRRR